MTSSDEDPCVAAIHAWEAAEQAYSEESSRYFAGGTLTPGQAVGRPERVLNAQALEHLSALRAAADDAQGHYETVCGNP